MKRGCSFRPLNVSSVSAISRRALSLSERPEISPSKASIIFCMPSSFSFTMPLWSSFAPSVSFCTPSMSSGAEPYIFLTPE